MYFVYDSLRTVTLEIYGVLVSGFISLLLYFITEAIHISFRGTFRNLQNFSKLPIRRRHFIMLFMINTFELSPHACYQNESSTKVWHFKQKLLHNFFVAYVCCLMWTLSWNWKSFCMFICLRLRINNINHNIATLKLSIPIFIMNIFYGEVSLLELAIFEVSIICIIVYKWFSWYNCICAIIYE